MTDSQGGIEYLRARAALWGLRKRRTPEALPLIQPLSEALADPDGQQFAAMVALTRKAEAILSAR